MKYATEEAYDALIEFSQNENVRDCVRMYLSEVPIGDEYGILTDYDWEIGEQFEDWA